MVEITDKDKKMEFLQALNEVNHSSIEIAIKTGFGQVAILDNDSDFLNLIWNEFSKCLIETAQTYKSVGFKLWEEEGAIPATDALSVEKSGSVQPELKAA